MRVSIDSGHLVISESGIPLLRIKAAISKRLGSCTQVGNTISVPRSSLPHIYDLFPKDTLSDALRRDLESYILHGKGRTEALHIVESCDTHGLPSCWQEILDPAQITAVKAMTQKCIMGLCLFDEQGCGKTVVSIAAFDILRELHLIDAMIVVCPKSMLGEWPKDIAKFTQNKYTVAIADGGRLQNYEAAFKDFDILVTNYEGIDGMLVPLLATAKKTKYLL